jgi:hypothetical protein
MGLRAADLASRRVTAPARGDARQPGPAGREIGVAGVKHVSVAYMLLTHSVEAENLSRAITMLVSLVAAVTAVSPAGATIRITGDRGGLITAYAERFEAARASGEPVIIDGPCLSACTLAIAILPRAQVCTTARAVLGFHAAWRRSTNGGRETSPAATKAMNDVYPARVRSWIAHHGGLSDRLILLKGRELAAMVPTCGPTLLSQLATRAVRRDLLPRATLAAQQKR